MGWTLDSPSSPGPLRHGHHRVPGKFRSRKFFRKPEGGPARMTDRAKPSVRRDQFLRTWVAALKISRRLPIKTTCFHIKIILGCAPQFLGTLPPLPHCPGGSLDSHPRGVDSGADARHITTRSSAVRRFTGRRGHAARAAWSNPGAGADGSRQGGSGPSSDPSHPAGISAGHRPSRRIPAAAPRRGISRFSRTRKMPPHGIPDRSRGQEIPSPPRSSRRSRAPGLDAAHWAGWTPASRQKT